MFMKRENTEWCQMYWFNTEIRYLPRILLIGDSIVAGHRNAVAERLKDSAAVGGFSSSKIVGDPGFYRELGLAMADYPVDYIYFNNGLHGLDCSDESYRHGLEELIQFLRTNTRARLIWRNSTPITEDGHPENLSGKLNPIVIRRNQIAAEVMKQYHIPVDDLYTPMLEHPEYRVKDGFHYQTAGTEAQADHIAATLKKALKNRTPEFNLNGFVTDFPGFIHDWDGCECCSFKLNGVHCKLVKPNAAPTSEKHWLWRTHLGETFPSPVDWALLDQGWYVAHIEAGELYGPAESDRRFDMLHRFLTSLGFNRKCVLASSGRSGPDICRWAAGNTDKINSLCLEDSRTLPEEKDKESGAPGERENCLKEDNLKTLADAKIPVLHLCADVPATENTMPVEKRYRELGGEIEVIYKRGAGLCSHRLENPQPIVDFIMKHLS